MLIIKNGLITDPVTGTEEILDIAIEGDKISRIARKIEPRSDPAKKSDLTERLDPAKKSELPEKAGRGAVASPLSMPPAAVSHPG